MSNEQKLTSDEQKGRSNNQKVSPLKKYFGTVSR